MSTKLDHFEVFVPYVGYVKLFFLLKLFICFCWGFTAQSTKWGHVKHGHFT